jgi:hypothetical protein
MPVPNSPFMSFRSATIWACTTTSSAETDQPEGLRRVRQPVRPRPLGPEPDRLERAELGDVGYHRLCMQ